MPIDCMIVDDDEMVLSHLRSLVVQTPFLNLLSFHTNPADALIAIENNSLKLVFLDINMPGLSGIELARIINNRKGPEAPRIIFTTGFEHFALEGYKVNALDYLLKPIDYEAFIKAAYKAKADIESHVKQAPGATGYTENDFIFLRVEYELVKVYLKNILYFEGFKDYVKVYVANSDNYIKSLTTMKSLEEKLTANSFMRVHRSFIVSLDKIDTITKNTVRVGKTLIPVSDQYKESFKKFTDKWF
ncbi:LytTR family DNA-binding domain-containing protein [Mucilaginibacter sabulilitoris]|uniref:LytTR family DNA-binding domain-containing protein n=1 Tax=Mucilaginibacter sabulilitoris TaxID=1173583 RepID=A0ABZ0TJM6_9SPHI|nr:LytTR family DNA-binding domain-containing protein [Mucilaginibacter sabulilitoris]WPU91390.1 LytTR family DNA-binding domain-containing protein [Mucilaginibacter sabulilitoris]